MTRALRHLGRLLFGDPKPQPSPEQMAAMHLYSTDARTVRAVPTRRPVKTRRSA